MGNDGVAKVIDVKDVS